MDKHLMTLEDFAKSYKDFSQDDLILDVRGPDEFSEGHVEGAKNIPHTEVQDHHESLKQYKNIYIYCRMGGRAKMAYEVLSQLGLGNIRCVYDAGMKAWAEEGLPLVTD